MKFLLECVSCYGTTATDDLATDDLRLPAAFSPIDERPHLCSSSSQTLAPPPSSSSSSSFAPPDELEDSTFCAAAADLQLSHIQTFYEVESKVDWSAYHDYCRNNALKYPLLVKRLACMIMSGSTPVDCLEILQPASLSPEATSKMEEEFDLLNDAFRKAKIDDKFLRFLTKDWYVGILSRIRINAFRIELIGGSFEDLLSMAAAAIEAESAVGNAVYILPSFYNHDCDPNTHIVWIDNVDAKLKALRDIEEGEELRICYIDASMDRNARQAILSKGFGFNCNCLRCLSGE